MYGFVLCADDYAMTAGVSRGILQLLEAGRLSATGAMTNRPHWQGFARELVPFEKHIDLGVHLNLTCAAPITTMPRFAPDGVFPQLGAIIKAGGLRQLPVPELIAEIGAQLDAFEESLGRAPDFIDGHQHVHGLAGVRDIFLSVISGRYKGAARPYVRVSADSTARIMRRGQFTQKAMTVKLLSAGFRGKLVKAGFAVNDGFAGFSGFDPAASYAAQFGSYLMAPGKRQLVMCHPGLVDDELRMLDPVLDARERELDFLKGADFKPVLAGNGAKMVRFGEI